LFQYNSAELTSKARRQLDAVAAALKSPKLGSYRFELQGHTDAAGGEEYNLALSQQRAQAVYDYLVLQHGIDPQRLTAVGVGEDDLLDSRNPMAEVNRRVKIINLGS
jgi:outer membrane protein OmpA-like peptidoglycan-associated protein